MTKRQRRAVARAQIRVSEQLCEDAGPVPQPAPKWELPTAADLRCWNKHRSRASMLAELPAWAPFPFPD